MKTSGFDLIATHGSFNYAPKKIYIIVIQGPTIVVCIVVFWPLLFLYLIVNMYVCM